MPAGDEAKDGSRRAEEVGNGSRLKKGGDVPACKSGERGAKNPVCPPGIKQKSGSRRAEEGGKWKPVEKKESCAGVQKAGREEPELQCPPGMKRKVEAGVQKKEEMGSRLKKRSRAPACRGRRKWKPGEKGSRAPACKSGREEPELQRARRG
ncbi:MAG: hypothetical protein ACLR23_07100 [Clostridia bacterium]